MWVAPPKDEDPAFNSQSWRAKWSDVKEAINEAEADMKKDAHTAAGLQPSVPARSVWPPIANPPALCSTFISCNNSLISVGSIKNGRPQAIYKFVDGKMDNHWPWVKVGSMSDGRYRHAVVPVRSGTALFVAGGYVRNPWQDKTIMKSSFVQLVIL